MLTKLRLVAVSIKVSALEIVLSWDTTTMNHIRERLSNGCITTKAVVADKYVAVASIAASNSIPLV
jgi:hypothetical protein